MTFFAAIPPKVLVLAFCAEKQAIVRPTDFRRQSEIAVAVKAKHALCLASIALRLRPLAGESWFFLNNVTVNAVRRIRLDRM